MRDQNMKKDMGKLRMELVPVSAIESLARVLTYGANKYEPEGWREVEPERYVGALLRHLCAYLKGQVYDHESGLMHIEQVLCNAAFLNEFQHGYVEETRCDIATEL